MSESVAYSTRSFGEVMTMAIPPPEILWGGIGLHQHGATAAIVGAPSIGKSRISIDLPVHQVCGIPFAGMPVHPTPVRWLIFNSENSLARIQHDLRGFAEILSKEAVERLGQYITVTTLETDGDGDFSLDTNDPGGGPNLRRIAETIAAVRPEVIVVDTWNALCPEELDSKAIRQAMRLMRQVATCFAGGPVTLIFVAHARPGIKEAAKAAGADAISFQRGSRVFGGIARTIWNVRACEVLDLQPVAVNPDVLPHVTRGLELINAKNSDGKILPPTAIVLDESTGFYRHLPDFDHVAWQQTLEKLAAGNATQTPGEKVAARAAIVQSGVTRVEQMLRERGPMIREKLVSALQAAGIAASGRAAREILAEWVADGKIKTYVKDHRSKVRYMTPEQYAEIGT